MFSAKNIAVMASILSLAAANPIPTDQVLPSLVPRASNEGIYLVNCQGGNEGVQSQMNYYKNAKSGSQNGQQPDSVAVISPTGSWVTWEGRGVTGNFNANTGGGSATSNINSNGQSVGVGNFAGTAKNSFGQNFNCFEDNGRQLHVGNGDPNFICRSIYYCFDA